MLDKLGLIAKVMGFLSFVKGARWIPPSGSAQDSDCAVMEFDVELSPSTVASIGIVTAILRKLDPRVDTDHPIFAYMGRQQEQGKPSRLTFTISMRRMEGD